MSDDNGQRDDLMPHGLFVTRPHIDPALEQYAVLVHPEDAPVDYRPGMKLVAWQPRMLVLSADELVVLANLLPDRRLSDRVIGLELVMSQESEDAAEESLVAKVADLLPATGEGTT